MAKAQLFTRDKFDEYMADDDDNVSAGSSRLGGLSGLRSVGSPAGKGLGGLGSPVGKSPMNKGLGGLGAKSAGLAAKPAGLGAKPAGSLGGLGSKTLGGLGIKAPGGLGARAPATGSLAGRAPAAPAGNDTFSKALDDVIKKTSSINLEMTSSINNIESEHVKALQSIASFVEALADKTVHGFREVSNRLNATAVADQPSLQESLDILVKNIDEEIAAKQDEEAYIIVPGHSTATVTTEEAAELIKGKSVRVFGGISQVAKAF